MAKPELIMVMEHYSYDRVQHHKDMTPVYRLLGKDGEYLISSSDEEFIKDLMFLLVQARSTRMLFDDC